ncbi:MAG: hypothetical protein HYR88_12430 [Verrucomicrobia bacterium]|nr:hypothetical protein [Verrucomicrobiota bacterium]MBI3869248.1 hypothetical protein [Verrucomicrobiota bacterium]
MINAVLLLVSPGPTWKRLASANRPAWAVLLFSFLPAVCISCAIEAWALAAHGTYEPSFQRVLKIDPTLAMRYGTCQAVFALGSLLLASMFIRNIAVGISVRSSFGQIFKTVAYALSAVYLFRIVDAWDFLNTWLVCGVAAVFVFGVLYTAMPHFIRPDPAKAFGLYLTFAVIVSACLIASHILSYLVLEETLFKGGFGLGFLGF